MASEPGQFRLEKSGQGYMWTLTTDLGQIIATSSVVPDKATAERTVQWVKDNASKCPTLDPPPVIGIA